MEKQYKFINAYLEGTLLKYTLDEPLIEGNVGVYQFKLDTSNFSEPRNSLWHALDKDESCKRVISFKNTKTSQVISDLMTRETKIIVDGDEEYTQVFWVTKVPKEVLIGGGRLHIGIRFFTYSEEIPTENISKALQEIMSKEPVLSQSYGTMELSNPPQIYSSNQFTTTIDVGEDTRFTALLQVLRGGKENEFLIKRSDGDYDATWARTLPGALIYGGSAQFDENGECEITLTPQAKEIIYQRGLFKNADGTDFIPTETTPLPNTIFLNFAKPEDYLGLEFLLKNNPPENKNPYNLGIGDKLVSDGANWVVIGVSPVSLKNSRVKENVFSHKSNPNPGKNFKIDIGADSLSIDLATLGGSLENFRNFATYAGELGSLQEEFLKREDTPARWVELGNCTFHVGKADTKYIIFPITTTNALVENFITRLENTPVIVQRWTTYLGRVFYRTGEVNSDWSEWKELVTGSLVDIDENSNTKASDKVAMICDESSLSSSNITREELERLSGAKENIQEALDKTARCDKENTFDKAQELPRLTVKPESEAAYITFEHKNSDPMVRLGMSSVNNAEYFAIWSYPNKTETDNRIEHKLIIPSNVVGKVNHNILTSPTIYNIVVGDHENLSPAEYKNTICLTKVTDNGN